MKWDYLKDYVVNMSRAEGKGPLLRLLLGNANRVTQATGAYIILLRGTVIFTRELVERWHQRRVHPSPRWSRATTEVVIPPADLGRSLCRFPFKLPCGVTSPSPTPSPVV